MTFQKGNQLAKGHNGGLRRDATIELITQLNEMCEAYDGKKPQRDKLHRLIENLIAKATIEGDVLDADGKLVRKGTGDLTAIQEILNRLEGKPSQKIVGPDNGPVQVEYKTIEEVHMFLLERGMSHVEFVDLHTHAEVSAEVELLRSDTTEVARFASACGIGSQTSGAHASLLMQAWLS